MMFDLNFEFSTRFICLFFKESFTQIDPIYWNKIKNNLD